MDISFGEIINLYKSEELIIRPEYQRLFRWTAKQKTALIESILLAIPIPPIFVSEDSNGVWDLIDGLQRISTVVSFFGELKKDLTVLEEIEYEDDEIVNETELAQVNIGNNWELLEGSIITSLEGFTIDTLPTKYKINIKRAVCRVEILRGESNTAMKYELFKRLNSGGSDLKPQETRNAIYRSENAEFYDLLIELCRNETFKKLTKLSKMKKRELYDQELILRFIALFNNVESVNENTENFLNNFMESAIKNQTLNLNDYKESFISVMNLLGQLNDDNIFRNKNNLLVPSQYEGITVGLAQNFEIFKDDLNLLKSKISELKEDEDFKKYSGSASNSKSRIKNRLKRANEIFST